MRTPRSIVIGDYDTHADGLWTLTGWSFSAAEHEQNLVKIPGSSELLDLSTSLTDGEPTYGSRVFTATFESSEGTRLAREEIINIMINSLDGYRLNIVLPDDAGHYIVGRVSVQKLYNDMAHASVQVTAVCDPWRYAKNETVVTLQASTTAQNGVLVNLGRRSVVPLLTVTEGDILLGYNGASWALSVGTYALPDIYLTYGEHVIAYSGAGVLTFTYREASL